MLRGGHRRQAAAQRLQARHTVIGMPPSIPRMVSPSPIDSTAHARASIRSWSDKRQLITTEQA